MRVRLLVTLTGFDATNAIFDIGDVLTVTAPVAAALAQAGYAVVVDEDEPETATVEQREQAVGRHTRERREWR